MLVNTVCFRAQDTLNGGRLGPGPLGQKVSTYSPYVHKGILEICMFSDS